MMSFYSFPSSVWPYYIVAYVAFNSSSISLPLLACIFCFAAFSLYLCYFLIFHSLDQGCRTRGLPCCLVWPVFRLTLLQNYKEVKMLMQLQKYIVIISVANRGRKSLGQRKHVHSSARAFNKYCCSEPVPKPLPRACPKGQKPKPNRHLLPWTLYICLKIQDGYIPQS